MGSGLAGVRVLVTRPERQASSMMARLRAAGAEPVLFPAIRVVAAADGGTALRAAAGAIGSFDWVVISSANGAEAMLAALEAAGTAGTGTAARWACVGPGTARVLRAAGVEPAVVAERHVAEGLLEALAGASLRGARILVPQAAAARPVLAQGLAAAGAAVHAVEAYRTVADARGAADVRERLERGGIEVVTFTSPSTVERFVEAVGGDIGGARVAVIGPVTAGAAAALGLEPAIVARDHTVEGLIEALQAYFDNDRRSD